MRNHLKVLSTLFFILLISCSDTTVIKKPVDIQSNYFNPKYQNEIVIFPTYKFLGHKKVDIDSSIAHRDYYVWQNESSDKYILVTILTPKKGVFDRNLEWIDRKSSIYSHDDIVAYNNVNERPAKIIKEFGGILPDCLIIAQQFYFHEKEVIYKALIVPDKMCSEDAEPVVRELNRVANMQS